MKYPIEFKPYGVSAYFTGRLQAIKGLVESFESEIERLNYAEAMAYLQNKDKAHWVDFLEVVEKDERRSIHHHTTESQNILNELNRQIQDLNQQYHNHLSPCQKSLSDYYRKLENENPD